MQSLLRARYMRMLLHLWIRTRFLPIVLAGMLGSHKTSAYASIDPFMLFMMRDTFNSSALPCGL